MTTRPNLEHAGKHKFIIVSNRLPVSISKEKGVLKISPSPGGLATAMSSLEGNTAKHLWIGWPGISSDDLTGADKSKITRELKKLSCYPVFLTKAQVKLFYEGYSNESIWPLFHYFKSLAIFKQRYWVAYQEVNSLFAQAVARMADERAAVWVHDYHLMILPKLLRDNLPNITIGFFLHIPFPSFELFRLLPNRKEILTGLLGADLIGFHVYDYVRHFTSSVLRTLGIDSSNGSLTLDGRIVKVDAFPIGIDYEKFSQAVEDDGVKKELALLEEHYKGQKLVLSVDRLDYSKGILQRLEAFELFLKNNPRQRKKVSLAIVAVPSRTSVGAYKDLREQIERTVSRINGAYTTLDWTPINYRFKNLPFEQLAALYIRADVALVTPLRDGMNLVAKEYVASKEQADGVLILSELTGAVDELPEALVINPYDTAMVAGAIKCALDMSHEEQRRRLITMQARISRYTVQRWATDFIEQQAAARHMQMRRSRKTLSKGKKEALLKSFREADTKKFILDYDGTLREFVSSPRPQSAAPSSNLISLIKDIAALPNTDLSIISGRTREALEEWFGALPVTLVAEHGFWVKQDGEWAQEMTDFGSHKTAIINLLEQYAERTPGALIEEKTFSVVWHYRNVTPELAFARNSALQHELLTLLEGSDIGAYSGHKIIEVKPRGTTKGVVLNELLVDKDYDFILCAGDDYTDEDMFKALPEEAYSIHVGSGETAAKYQVPSTTQLLNLLRSMLD